MNPFKGGCGRKCKCKSKCVEVEVKQEVVIKEEPNVDDGVETVSLPNIDGTNRADFEGTSDFDNDFVEVKDEVKCEEEEGSRGRDSSPCERSNENVANAEDIAEPLTDGIDVQQPKPAGSGRKVNGNSKRHNKRSIPRNQAVKKQTKHKCHVCNHLASHKGNLKIHLRVHSEEKPFKCDVCSKSFSQKGNFNLHQKSHGQVRCSKCKQGFEQESVKIDHERLCNPRRFECDFCGYETMRKPDLKRHMQIHSGEKPFVCSICSKSFQSNSNVQRHSMIHKDELPNSCAKCRRRFATPDEKQTHEINCQGSLFACNQCQYKTVQKSHLKRHIQSKHGAKRSIECEICNKQFVEQLLLNQHLSTAHGNQFPFECSKCFGGYATKGERNVHEAWCGHRQYQCYLCKDRSRNKQRLEYHMRKVHTGERFQCKFCATRFIAKNGANHHMKIVHRLKQQ